MNSFSGEAGHCTVHDVRNWCLSFDVVGSPVRPPTITLTRCSQSPANFSPDSPISRKTLQVWSLYFALLVSNLKMSAAIEWCQYQCCHFSISKLLINQCIVLGVFGKNNQYIVQLDLEFAENLSQWSYLVTLWQPWKWTRVRKGGPLQLGMGQVALQTLQSHQKVTQW